MRVTPIGSRILVRPMLDEAVTSSGIVIPDNSQARPQRGKVVAVGPGAPGRDGARIPPPVKRGDVVVYTSRKRDMLSIHDDSPQLIMLAEGELLAVVED